MTVRQNAYVHYSTAEGVDATMDKIREQMDLTNDISDAISNPVGMGIVLDEVRQWYAFSELLLISHVSG